MMKHKNKRFIYLNEAFHFYDPLFANFQCFVSLLITFVNKSRNEKVFQPFHLFKNQHPEKMLVFFCCIIGASVKLSTNFLFNQQKLSSAFVKRLPVLTEKIN